MKPQLVEQNILAIYFDKNGVVTQKANYTLQDGKVFDTISRTTPTGGKDLTFLQQLLSGGPAGAGIARAFWAATTTATEQGARPNSETGYRRDARFFCV